MAVKTSTLVRISTVLAVLAFGSGCRKPLLGPRGWNTHSRVWCWAGDPGRTGYSTEIVGRSPKPVWTYRAMSGVGNAIVVRDSLLFFGKKGGGISALDIRKGKVAAEFRTVGKGEVTCCPEETRLVVVERIAKPSVYALDLLTGRRLWKADFGMIDGEPLVCDSRVILGNSDGVVFALDSRSGSQIWKKEIDEPVFSSPAQSGDTVVVVGAEGGVRAFSARDGNILWEHDEGGSVDSGPVIRNGRVFVGFHGGAFRCFSLSDGRLLWMHQGEGSVFTTAAASDVSVFYGTSQGVLYCLDPKDGLVRWSFQTGSVVGTSPWVGPTAVIFGTLDMDLIALDPSTGRELWRIRVKGRLRTSPLVWKGMVVTASEDSYVYAFR